MLQSFVALLIKLSQIRRNTVYKLLSLLTGAVFFLALLPALFIELGLRLEFLLPTIPLSPALSYCLTVVTLLAWTTVTQWRIGGGTPAPNAPTQRLVISGPYRLCRNPIQLGAVLYYLGLGILISSLIVGIIAGLLGLLVGTCYHKLVEEKELELRFGADYLEYKNNTPFLLPRLRDLLNIQSWFST